MGSVMVLNGHFCCFVEAVRLFCNGVRVGSCGFLSRSTYTLLLDGETIMSTKEAKEAMQVCGVRMLPGWPAHSPDLNPQENVWAWTEKHLRKAEKDTDTLTVFKRRILDITKRYEGKEKLVPSMVERLALCAVN